ncbi:MAG: hypothetical protein PWQ57_697 [Desulfovibrionales bacterium]|jgi:hypothetical protein|nr:hypothetical protein [Desulfovibrionales bacterium]
MGKVILAVAVLAVTVWVGIGVKYMMDNHVEIAELDSRVAFGGDLDKNNVNLQQWEIRTLNYAVSKNEELLNNIYVILNPEDPGQSLNENSTLHFQLSLTLANQGMVEIPERNIRRGQLAELVYNLVEAQLASIKKLRSMPELKDKNVTRVIN